MAYGIRIVHPLSELERARDPCGLAAGYCEGAATACRAVSKGACHVSGREQRRQVQGLQQNSRFYHLHIACPSADVPSNDGTLCSGWWQAARRQVQAAGRGNARSVAATVSIDNQFSLHLSLPPSPIFNLTEAPSRKEQPPHFVP